MELSLHKFAAAAKKHGCQVVVCAGEYHYQVIGNYLVNYYPDSKNQTAYVSGMARGIHDITPAQAIQLAVNGNLEQESLEGFK